MTAQIIIGGWTPDIPGAQPYVCQGHGGVVYLAPSGQHLQRQHSLVVLCMRCGLRAMLRDSAAQSMPLTAAQLAELVLLRGET